MCATRRLPLLSLLIIPFLFSAAPATSQNESPGQETTVPVNLTPLEPQTYFGINGVGFFHRPDDDAEHARRWELMKELGVRWDRSDFWWSRLEPRPGEWDYSQGDRAMEMYRSHGVQILPILDYGAAWRDTRGPVDDQQREEWARFVSNVLLRYQGYARTWEVWNEPNIIPFWRPQPDAAAYARLLEITAQTARAAHPDVSLLGFSLAGADHEFLERTLALAGTSPFDSFSYHYYRTTQPEITTPDEIAALRLILRHFGKECPIWITEQGVTSNLREGVSEELQAIYWMREILLQIASGVERTFPFNLVDNVTDPGGPWGAELGMVSLEWRKKPVFHAYKTMISELDQYTLTGPVDLGYGDGVHALLFERREGAAEDEPANKLALWSTGDAMDVRLTIDDIQTTIGPDSKTRALSSIPSQLTTCTTLLGEQRAIELDGATQRFAVSPSPLYVPVSNRRLVENARTRFDPTEIMMSPGHSGSAALAIELSDAETTGIRYTVPSGWSREQKPDDPATLRFTVPVRASSGWYSIHAVIPGAAGTITKTLRVWVRPEVRAQVRPLVTSEAADIVTSFTLHNQNLAADTLWRFLADPPLPGNVTLANGSLRSGKSGGTAEYMVETAMRLPRQALESIQKPTTLYLFTVSHGADQRPAEKMHPAYRIGMIGFSETPPVLDGRWQEYGRYGTMILGQPEQVLRSDWRREWSGEQDSSAIIGAIWTPDGLYVGANVRDDHPAMNDRGVGGDVYKGDGVEIYIGTRGYKGEYYASKENGYYHFALTPGRQGEGAAVSDFANEVPGSRIAVQVERDRYIMEAFIPKEAFNNFVPGKGDIVPFDLQLNDRDDYSPTARSSSLMWNGDEMNWLRAGKWGLAVIK